MKKVSVKHFGNSEGYFNPLTHDKGTADPNLKFFFVFQWVKIRKRVFSDHKINPFRLFF